MRTWPVWMALLLAAGAAAAEADRLAEAAAVWDRRLRDSILPYWHDSTADPDHGGFRLDDPPSGGPVDKSLVTQARMVWTFARVHRAGYSDARRNYLRAADGGVEFLMRRFRDPVHGGYYWAVDAAGAPRNERKMIYGQAFVIYALVEHFRASSNGASRAAAMELFAAIQRRAHDPRHGGWIEHFERDWTPLPLRSPHGMPEVAGLKSANTHLHLMEAFTDLYAATGDPAVRAALEEALRINKEFFYPAEPGRSCFHRYPDWSEVTDPRSAGLSYGHNVEFAWLMLEAERTLGRPLSVAHFQSHLDHALRCGWDAERGGLYHRGEGDRPASDRKKVWWVQAEMVAALSERWALEPRPATAADLLTLIGFIDRHMADPRDGVWVDSVEEDGRPLRPARAHGWKANYHDVRAMLKFIDAVRHPAR